MDDDLEITIEDDEIINVSVNDDETLTASLDTAVSVSASETTGTTDYEDLENKPSINEVTLIGDKSFEELGLESLTNLEIEDLINSQI